jgi:transposase-like protein
LGCAVDHSADGAVWTEFLRSLRARRLKGVRLVISDQHLAIFAQPDATSVREQFDLIVGTLEGQVPDVATMLTDAKEDLLAFSAFPEAQWLKVWFLRAGGTPPPGDQAAHRLGRGLPERSSGRTPGDRGVVETPDE